MNFKTKYKIGQTLWAWDNYPKEIHVFSVTICHDNSTRIFYGTLEADEFNENEIFETKQELLDHKINDSLKLIERMKAFSK
jgi:hypothetical protein